MSRSTSDLSSKRALVLGRILKCGEEMSPCQLCIRTKARCVVSKDDSSRCYECYRLKKSRCDFTAKLPSASDWASIDKQRARLRQERKEALSKAQEAMAKVMRISVLEGALDDRERKMVSLGLKTLDELDKVEEEEKATIAANEAAVQSLSEASDFVADPTLDPHAFLDLPESFWANIAFSSVMVDNVGGSPGVSQSNS